ncbi:MULTISPECIES: transglycosylase SLT domain-containing protein [unclassified Campylobacter]|uniref:transglycosylase SLT domain-containing protein n=1 Tax=unclassified Campylobacter TaxID=2593542 RepID=UPI001238314A|nr:hypothetical protein FMM54_06355 [Campylobacter sp. LR185c]KAA6227102.1 hypothetical protein FMM55_03750 [Campylobacter sp. LR196d]KAA6228773.1 hypothetical protein FMM57_02215 [Campylobacter sp. LR286c]KAA6229584.1 hypothetical protein FMM56_08170 [Campylobacter sp. LR264d]KAA6230829.1 hypothetical protein FMM58_04925 [Campylobacter sp. LR291e]
MTSRSLFKRFEDRLENYLKFANNTYKIDYKIILAIAYKESRFNAKTINAINKKNTKLLKIIYFNIAIV